MWNWTRNLFGRRNTMPLFSERCRWCSRRIGEITHHPIPLCGRCMDAVEADVLGRPALQRLGHELPRELMAFVKRVAVGHVESVTRFDGLLCANQALEDVWREAAAVGACANTPEALARNNEVQRRIRAIADFKTEFPALVDAVERGEQ